MNEVEPNAQNIFSHLMSAIKDNSYRDFIRQGDWGFKIGIPIFMFWLVSAQLANRMKKGYQVTYLGDLNQSTEAKHQGFLWKLTFADEGTEFIARLALNKSNRKASGLMISPW